MKSAEEYEALWKSGAFEVKKPTRVKKEELIDKTLKPALIFGGGVLVGAWLNRVLARKSTKSPRQ